MQYVYPAVFTKEEEAYNVTFPNFPECNTFGIGMADAIKMAEDVLCLHLYHLEENQEDIPMAANIGDVEHTDDSIVSLIACDTLEYRKFFGKQAVKKTVTLPAWLNTMAENANINFSSILQQGLKAQLKVD